jgi:hypothetical protein
MDPASPLAQADASIRAVPVVEGQLEASVYLATLPGDGPSGILWSYLWTADGNGGYGRLDW